jgi:Protein of unknown function (DUF2673)
MEHIMFKRFALAAVIVAFASPVFAAECTQADIDKMTVTTKAMTDKTQQDMAMKELAAAQDMMTKKDTAGCVAQLDKVTKIVTPKM